jgi:hypothetical protein
MRKPQYSLILVLLGLAWLNACTVLKSRSVEELVMLAAEDGDRKLREPMRPIRGGVRVLIFALDGVGHDDFIRAVRTGLMPRTSMLFGGARDEEGTFAHAYSAPDVLSVLPSSTTAAWTSVFTGRPPADTGIPGNEWFDREHVQFYAPSPITTDRRYQVIGSYNQDRLGERIRVPTLYERASVRSHVSLLQVYRGADMLNVPEVEPFGSLFNAALIDALSARPAGSKFYEKLDHVSIKSLNESLYRYGFADLQVVYFPGIDLFTHIATSPLESQQQYLSRVIDPAVGDVLDRYDERGILDSTYVLFISDHGQTRVRPENQNALWREGDDEPPALLRAAGFRVRSRALKTDGDEVDFQAVLAMQGGMANVYLADRSTCPEAGMSCDWSRPPRFEEDLMTVVRAFDEANRAGAHVPALEGTLDLILARTNAVPGGIAPPFKVFDGERLVKIEDYLRDRPRPDLLKLDVRLKDLAAGPYGYLAGDILLLSRMRLDEPVHERTYFGEPYNTWHGSPNRQDSQVVFVLVHVRKSGAVLRRLARSAFGLFPSQMSLTPLVLELLE